MAKVVEAQCGYCRKRFRLRPDQVGRKVRCPYCKTRVRIPRRTEAAEDAVRALKAGGRPPGGPAAGHRPGAPSQGGVRNRNLAVAWAVGIGLGLIGAIVGLVLLLGDYPPPGSRGAGRESAETDIGDGSSTGRVGGAAGETGTGGETAPGPAAGAELPAARPAGKQTRTRSPLPSPLQPDIKKILRGYADETLTYVVGHVTNTSDRTIRSMRIVVELRVEEGGKKVGDATAVILNLPPKHTAPVVAECNHAAGLRAKYWKIIRCQTAPAGVPDDLPPLEARNAVPIGDPNAPEPTGLVRALVTNRGKVPVKDILMSALLLDEKGKIVGAARHRASQKIEPGATEAVEIEWRQTADTLVRNVEVWVQPHFYQEK